MKKIFEIKVENSAPSQTRPAKSVIWACNILGNNGVNNIVDLGCGRLRNLDPLIKYFNEITLVDTKLQCERIRNLVPKRNNIRLICNSDFTQSNTQYDAIFLISVFHIIPKPKDRKDLLNTAVSKLKKNGYLIIDIPTAVTYYKRLCTEEKKYYDGHIMGNGKIRTFYKNYLAKEFDKFLYSNNEISFFKKVYFDKHIIRIMQKTLKNMDEIKN